MVCEWLTTSTRSWVCSAASRLTSASISRRGTIRLSIANTFASWKSRFSETQIVEILKEGEAGLPVAERFRKHGISRATYVQWKAKYRGATVADLKRLQELGKTRTLCSCL